MSYRQIIYQIVFGPKYRKKVLDANGRPQLFKYISGILANKNCQLYQVNGIEDHIHIVFSLHPSVSLASLVKDIKVASNKFIKEEKLFLEFTSWQKSYAAFTYTIEAKERLIAYVKNQVEHHSKKDYEKEVRELFQEHDVEFDERFFL